MRPRDPLLACSLALLLVASGCLGAPGGRPATGTDPVDTSPSPSPEATALPGDPVAWPDGPKERPPTPAALNESAVGDYAVTHEYRYVYNSLWFDRSTEVTVECDLDGVERERGAWRATVTCTGYSDSDGTTDDGTITGTPAPHADYFTQTWVYWIDRDADGDTVVHRVRAAD
ncbi:hypothetical protein [Halobaculum lipolyticum]|uniref:Lipoprotein n=1 Tax=Halobaculum lipolyticum TaxID=3032001 RepID=A0ABD5WC63_9EURY|nr:hypothetical protein [Halobaculum sp. DT31]